jgi:hypothetical protein
MAETTMHVVLDVKNLERMGLFVWELIALQDEMRVMASPHAERLESLITRFVDGDEADDRPEPPGG